MSEVSEPFEVASEHAAAPPATSGRTFRSLQHRNFRLFFTGQLISQVGNWITLIAQSLLVYELTDSGVALGVLVACQFVPVLLTGAWAGVIADRTDKRRMLIVAQTFAMFQSFALAALALMDRPPVLAVYALAAAGGLATSFDNPARRSFVVEMVPETDVQNAISLNTALMTGSRVFGPALAGLLVTTAGYSWCFAIDGLSYAAVLYSLWVMNPSELRRPEVSPRSKGQVREGIRYVRSVPDLWIPLAMTAIVGMLAFNFNVVLQLLVLRTFDGREGEFTALLSIMSLGSVTGALLAARRTSVSVNAVAMSSAAFGIAMFVMAATPTLWSAYLAAVLMGFAAVMFMTTSTSIVQLRAAPAMRGRVVALQTIVFLGATPIGGPIIGAVSEYAGARVGLVLGGLSGVCAAAFGWAAQRHVAERHTGGAGPAAPISAA